MIWTIIIATLLFRPALALAITLHQYREASRLKADWDSKKDH